MLSDVGNRCSRGQVACAATGVANAKAAVVKIICARHIFPQLRDNSILNRPIRIGRKRSQIEKTPVIKRLTIVCIGALLTLSAAPDAFGWGAVSGPRGGAGYPGPYGGAGIGRGTALPRVPRQVSQSVPPPAPQRPRVTRPLAITHPTTAIRRLTISRGRGSRVYSLRLFARLLDAVRNTESQRS